MMVFIHFKTPWLLNPDDKYQLKATLGHMVILLNIYWAEESNFFSQTCPQPGKEPRVFLVLKTPIRQIIEENM